MYFLLLMLKSGQKRSLCSRRRFIQRFLRYRQFGCSFSYDPKTYALLDELFSQLMQIEPSMKNNAWNLWLM